MQTFDFCLAWNWEYDAGFVRILNETCLRHDRTLLQATPGNLGEICRGLGFGGITFRAFFDRASDSDPAFNSLADWVNQNNIQQINPRQYSAWTQDKAAVHLAFLESGLSTPYTHLLPSLKEQPDLPAHDLSLLGDSFAIKPASGGGGEGVVLEATCLEQVNAERQRNPQEKYLLQAQVEPRYFGFHQAWFRVVFCGGEIHPCWWDTHSHVYSPVTEEDETNYSLGSVREITGRIASVCKLDLFSSEIALTSTGYFVVVDYINDPIDLRLQSEAVDGIPDEIVVKICKRLVGIMRG